MAYSSHMVKQRNRSDTCQYSPVSTPLPQSSQEQPSLFAASKPWSFCFYQRLFLWRILLPGTLLRNSLRFSLCQDDLAHSWHIDWNSVETFESIFFLKKNIRIKVKKKTQLTFVQLPGFVPDWREQLTTNSS